MIYLEKGRAWRIARYSGSKVEHSYYYNVSVPEAKEIIRGLVKDDLTDDTIDVNSFGYEYGQVVNGSVEWSEWYDDESGQDIMEIIDEEDERFTACVKCKNLINKEPKSARKDIWYNHLCKANKSKLSTDPYSGKIKPRGEKYRYCRDINNGSCKDFKQTN